MQLLHAYNLNSECAAVTKIVGTVENVLRAPEIFWSACCLSQKIGVLFFRSHGNMALKKVDWSEVAVTIWCKARHSSN